MRAVAGAIDRQNEYTVGHIIARYLSFPRTSPPTMRGLRVITGRLRASIRRKPARIIRSGVRSAIGTNVRYAAIHEFGGVIPPHVITPRRGKALAFTFRGRQVFARRVRHPGATIPARAPIQHGILDRLQDYEQDIGRSMSRAAVEVMGWRRGSQPPQS